MKNTNAPLYQHVRAELVSPRIMTLAADWQVWDSAKEGTEGTIHIDYDGGSFLEVKTALGRFFGFPLATRTR